MLPNEPFTEEQLAAMSREVQHTARKMLHIYVRNAVIGFVILLVANIYVWSTAQTLNSDAREAIVQSGRAVSVDGCNRDFQTINALRGILTAAQSERARALKRGEISPQQFQRAQEFYHQQLANLQLPDCEQSREILTDEKDRAPLVPQPLRP